MVDVRLARLRAYRALNENHWSVKLGFAAAFAGLTALLAQLSVPLPWTPVPFTFQVLAVGLTGVMLGGRWAVVSMLIYVAAGAAGLHVFAPSSNGFNPDTLYHADRWRILVPDAVAKTGFTAGYIFGFAAAAGFVGAYLRRRNDGLEARWMLAASLGVLLLLLGAVGAGFFLAGGGTFAGSSAGAAYGGVGDLLWLFAGLFLVLAPLVGWLLTRHRGGSEALKLYVVLLGAIGILHLCGVLVLKPTLGLTWTEAFALGSTVFLPFDVLKAGLAVLISVAFLPTRQDLTPEATA